MAPTSVSADNRAPKGVWTVTTIIAALALCLIGCDRSSSDAGSEAANTTPKLDYGTKVNFGKGGNSDVFKVSGWSKTEEKFTWSEGTTAVLKMSIAPTNDTITLKMTIAALIKEPEIPFQPVEVSVNDKNIAEWQVGEAAEFVARIPPDLTSKGGVLNITIKTPKATSPKALGLSADPRVLGICCLDLELAKS